MSGIPWTLKEIINLVEKDRPQSIALFKVYLVQDNFLHMGVTEGFSHLLLPVTLLRQTAALHCTTLHWTEQSCSYCKINVFYILNQFEKD
jgi:hypothetical protein